MKVELLAKKRIHATSSSKVVSVIITRDLLSELLPGLGLLLLVVVVLEAHLVLALRPGLLHLGHN